jgi:hypothetical protein
MNWWIVVFIGWLGLGIVIGLLIGRAIRTADEKEKHGV